MSTEHVQAVFAQAAGLGWNRALLSPVFTGWCTVLALALKQVQHHFPPICSREAAASAQHSHPLSGLHSTTWNDQLQGELRSACGMQHQLLPDCCCISMLPTC